MIQSRPPKNGRTLGSSTTGLRRTGLETERDGALYVPASFRPDRPSPLIVAFHGAGGNAENAIRPLKDLVDHTGAIILAPEYQGPTWDLILNGFGADIHWLDEALSDVFALYPIDSRKIAAVGFSDGASYALSVGLTNGDLFSHVMAFSPGFSAPSTVKGSPQIFISHGLTDQVLKADQCSRKLVPQLKKAGLQVTYREFNAGHTIPHEVLEEAWAWFLKEPVRKEEPLYFQEAPSL